MNIYDMAHEMARALKNCEEYRECERTWQTACESDATRQVLEEYKRLRANIQTGMAMGKPINEDEMERLRKVSQLAQLSPEASAYMFAEFRLQRVLGDIYKILGEAAGLDMDALTGAP